MPSRRAPLLRFCFLIGAMITFVVALWIIGAAEARATAEPLVIGGGSHVDHPSPGATSVEDRQGRLSCFSRRCAASPQRPHLAIPPAGPFAPPTAPLQAHAHVLPPLHAPVSPIAARSIVPAPAPHQPHTGSAPAPARPERTAQRSDIPLNRPLGTLPVSVSGARGLPHQSIRHGVTQLLPTPVNDSLKMVRCRSGDVSDSWVARPVFGPGCIASRPHGIRWADLLHSRWQVPAHVSIGARAAAFGWWGIAGSARYVGSSPARSNPQAPSRGEWPPLAPGPSGERTSLPPLTEGTGQGSSSGVAGGGNGSHSTPVAFLDSWLPMLPGQCWSAFLPSLILRGSFVPSPEERPG